VKLIARPFVRRVIVAVSVAPSTVTVWPIADRTM
jgi:hypothetical protein